MNRSVFRLAAVVGILALLGLCPPASVLAEGVPAAVAVPAVHRPEMGPSDSPFTASVVTKEQAVASLKRYFPFPEGPGTIDATLMTSGSHMTWQIMYIVDRENGGSSSSYLGAVDAQTGKILGFQRDTRQRPAISTGPLPQPYPESYARTWAWLLVRDLYPSEEASLRPVPHEEREMFFAPGNDDYVFAWAQYHGDIPVAGPTVTVAIDKYNLDYTAFSAEFLNLTFLPGEAKITPAEADKHYREALVPRLAYHPVSLPYRSRRDASAMRLVYRVDHIGVLDAISGRFMDETGKEVPAAVPAEPVPGGAAPFFKPQELPLDSSRAMAFAREFLQVPEGAEFEMASGARSYGQGDELEFNWFTETGSASVLIDPKSGLIHQAYRNPPDASGADQGDSEGAPPDPARQAKAKAAAIAVVQRYYGALAAEVKLETGLHAAYMGDGSGTSFFFQRYINGIPAGYDGITVNVDPATMDWMAISMNWTTDVQFPAVDGVMTVAQATERLFAGSEPELVYQPTLASEHPGGAEPPVTSEEGQLRQAMLVYRLGPDRGFPGMELLDAHSGQALDWSGRSRTALEDARRSLADHWAEGELRYMLNQGSLNPEQLNPDGTLNRANALGMLLTAQENFFWYPGARATAQPYKNVEPEDPLYILLQEAVRQGVLRPEGDAPVFDGEAPITRAEFAVWLIRALKLDDLARSELVTTSTFTDTAGLSIEEQHAAAFLQALGIASRGPTFRGGAPLTQAEAAAFTVRLLKHQRQRR